MSGYEGSAPQYVSLLQQHGWLDGKLLHDWLDYAGNYLVRKYHNSHRRKLIDIWLRHGRRYGKSASLSHTKGRSPPSKVRLSPLGSKTKEGDSGGDWPTPEKLVELYNSLTPDECPAVTTLSPARRSKARQYLTAFPKQDFWEQVFKRVHQSKFLRGAHNGNGNGHGNFRFDFDWMLTKGKDGSENAVKVFEGRYADER